MKASRSLPACCAGTISTRSPCKPAKTICRSCALFSNNVSAALVFDKGRSQERWSNGVISNEMNSPATTPLLQYSLTPLLLAEEFHDIAPPIDYSLISPWLIFLGVFVLLTTIGLIVWFVAKSFRRPTPPQPPRERALALLEQIRTQITAINPYRFSICVSDILRSYVT